MSVLVLFSFISMLYKGYGAVMIRSLLILLFLSRYLMCVSAYPVSAESTGDTASITYTRSALFELQLRTLYKPVDFEDFPQEIKPKKRGKREGIRKRTRARRTNPPLPTILLGNVRSLTNKMDELSACTWYLHDNIPDSTVDLPNFNIVRGDRSLDSEKSKGGGVCLYINNSWCNNWSVKERFCTPDYELLTVGLRPYYLPREFNQIFVMVVYIQPRANFHVASEAIASRIQRLESTSLDSAKFVLGDFNHCRLDQVLPSYHQFVNKPTRGDAVLDLHVHVCYGNIASA